MTTLAPAGVGLLAGDRLPSQRAVLSKLDRILTAYDEGAEGRESTLASIVETLPTLDVLQYRSHKTAADKGWWPEVPTDPAAVAKSFLLMVTEIAEAYEDVRVHRGLEEVLYSKRIKTKVINPVTGVEEEHAIEYLVPKDTPGAKPCGILSELADVVIRILDFCGAHKLDLQGMILEKMSYNDTREFRHGNKAA